MTEKSKELENSSSKIEDKKVDLKKAKLKSEKFDFIAKAKENLEVPIGKLNKVLKKDPDSNFQQLEIGFKVESKLEVFKKNYRKKLNTNIEALKVSGFFGDIWMWNIVFLNLFFAFMAAYLIGSNLDLLPSLVGFNTNDDRYLDFVFGKSWLWFIPIMHLIFAVVFLTLGVKSEKKLSSLYVSSFFQILVIMGFELLALRNFIVYFL